MKNRNLLFIVHRIACATGVPIHFSAYKLLLNKSLFRFIFVGNRYRGGENLGDFIFGGEIFPDSPENRTKIVDKTEKKR
jgi:hypothetical protein